MKREMSEAIVNAYGNAVALTEKSLSNEHMRMVNDLHDELYTFLIMLLCDESKGGGRE